jgi:tyrosyl-tRNA synthetase
MKNEPAKKNAFDTLMERGFIAQCSHVELRDLMERESLTFYIGFDPTADSLHVGHYIQLMAMAHMQKAGHRPIALIGGGTTMVGDPSGRTDLRKMMTKETIAENARKLKAQMSRLMDFSEGGAMMVDNAEWLLELNYIDFLRDIGSLFSVNRMLTAECFKQRLEKGLSFLEFNYMLMQSYDFLVLFQRYGCRLQMGGDDQWSNILSGADLIRRKEQGEAFALTCTLLTTSDGKKMGKTEKGALWLAADKTSPYEFYQYWRNVGDEDVERCLKLLTFLPLDKINDLCMHRDERINNAKETLAYEITRQVHGEEEANAAREAAKALFGRGGAEEAIPGMTLSRAQLLENAKVIDLLVLSKLAPSKGEARRLIEGGGIHMNENKVEDVFAALTDKDIDNGHVMIRKGKKTFFRFTIEG